MDNDALQPVIAEDSMLAELPEDDDAEVAEEASGSSPSTEAEPPEAEAEPIDDAPDPNGPDTEGEQADPESGEEEAEREAASALARAAPAEPVEDDEDEAAPEWALAAVPVGHEELEAEQVEEEEGFDLMRWLKKNWMWAVPTAIAIYLIVIGLDTAEERAAFPGSLAPFQ